MIKAELIAFNAVGMILASFYPATYTADFTLWERTQSGSIPVMVEFTLSTVIVTSDDFDVGDTETSLKNAFATCCIVNMHEQASVAYSIHDNDKLM